MPPPAAASSNREKITAFPPALVPDGWEKTGKLGLGFSLDLDLWGKNRAALAAARLDIEAAGYELAEIRLVLTTSIAATYADHRAYKPVASEVALLHRYCRSSLADVAATSQWKRDRQRDSRPLRSQAHDGERRHRDPLPELQPIDSSASSARGPWLAAGRTSLSGLPCHQQPTGPRTSFRQNLVKAR